MKRQRELYWVEVVCEVCSEVRDGAWVSLPGCKRQIAELKKGALAGGFILEQNLFFCSPKCRDAGLERHSLDPLEGLCDG